MLDDLLEFEGFIGKGEGAFGRSVEILDAMTSEMDPIALTHLFENTVDRPTTVLDSDDFNGGST